MKFLSSILLSFLFSVFSFGQTPNWKWARGSSGHSTDIAYSVAADSQGNVYVAGNFTGPMYFGSDTLSGVSPNDAFLVKYDSVGNVIWLRCMGGADNAYSLSIGNGGSIYVSGDFQSTYALFGSDTIFNSGGIQCFLAKYDLNGNTIWVRSSSVGTNASGASVTHDLMGNIYLAGRFSSKTVFDKDTLNSIGTSSDIFLVKYDSLGSILWAKQAGGSGNDYSSSVTVDVFGNAYVAGKFSSSSIIFGNDTLLNNSVGPYSDVFIMKFDSSGNMLWGRSAGGSASDQATAVVVGPMGSVFLAGSFQSPTIKFGTTVLLNNNLWGNMFLVKYSSIGNVLWAKAPIGNNRTVEAYSIVTDIFENPIVAGCFSGYAVVFDSDTISNPDTLNYLIDMFVVKYSSFGNELWAKSAGGSSEDYAFAICHDDFGNIYIAGGFDSDTLIFNSDTLSGLNNPYDNIFVAKLTDANISSVANNLNSAICLKAYPNPTAGIFAIQNEKAEQINVKIYSDLGLMVLDLNSSNKLSMVDISSYPNGIYFVEIIGKDIRYFAKVIKQ